MIKLRVFVSSIQKELASERMALSVLMTADPFLQKHTVPKLWEMEPAPLTSGKVPYLDLLRVCQVCVLIIGREYGDSGTDGLSAIQREYRLARELRLPTLVCLKNVSDREKKTEDLLAEIKKDGHTYSRFASLEELHKKVRDRLVRHIKITYHLEPSSEETRIAENSEGVASLFERQRITNIAWKDTDQILVQQLIGAIGVSDPVKLKEKESRTALVDRGYLWFDEEQNIFCATAAGALLLAKDPTVAFPQSRVQIDAYFGTVKTDQASDYDFLRGPISKVLQNAWAFVRRNTRHPLRIVGLRRVDIDEYPEKAFREALVNALAHRDYQDASRKVRVEVFADRIVISSPGLPPGNQSIRRIAQGKAQPRARNPLLTQGLAWLEHMDDRGTGILRMKNAMLDHGLDEPQYAVDDGTFVVTLIGPGKNLERLRAPIHGNELSPAVKAALTARQKRILSHALKSGTVDRAWCKKTFGIGHDVASGDLRVLVTHNLLRRVGQGRSTAYVPEIKNVHEQSSDNRPMKTHNRPMPTHNNHKGTVK